MAVNNVLVAWAFLWQIIATMIVQPQAEQFPKMENASNLFLWD